MREQASQPQEFVVRTAQPTPEGRNRRRQSCSRFETRKRVRPASDPKGSEPRRTQDRVRQRNGPRFPPARIPAEAKPAESFRKKPLRRKSKRQPAEKRFPRPKASAAQQEPPERSGTTKVRAGTGSARRHFFFDRARRVSSDSVRREAAGSRPSAATVRRPSAGRFPRTAKARGTRRPATGSVRPRCRSPRAGTAFGDSCTSAGRGNGRSARRRTSGPKNPCAIPRRTSSAPRDNRPRESAKSCRSRYRNRARSASRPPRQPSVSGRRTRRPCRTSTARRACLRRLSER